MISIILSAIKIIVLLGFLIFIHELGHFTVAKLCNVKVNEFALGFGPILLKKQGKETKYELRLIPLGGFVSMEGETIQSSSKRAFNKASIPKRIAIVSAGGLVNIFFAIIVFMVLQLAVGNNTTTQIESTMPGYASELVGIKSGDIIKKINGKKVRIQSDINDIMEKNNGEELTLIINRDGNEFEQKITPTAKDYYTTGMYLESENSTKIQAFSPDESIEQYGFKVGDKILQIEGENVEDNSVKLSEAIENNSEKEELKFVVKRLGKELTITAKPIKKTRYYLGVNLAMAENNFSNNFYYGMINTGNFASSIVENLHQLVTGKVRASDFMGPIGISKTVAKTNSIESFITILALVSLSLGVTNLLPFPPLDGGKNVLLIIEAVRRKPLEERYEVGIQMAGFALMIMLSLYVTYHDIIRII